MGDYKKDHFKVRCMELCSGSVGNVQVIDCVSNKCFFIY